MRCVGLPHVIIQFLKIDIKVDGGVLGHGLDIEVVTVLQAAFYAVQKSFKDDRTNLEFFGQLTQGSR